MNRALSGFIALGLASGLLFGAVDINSADKKELETLSGIGPATAEKIIEYRNEGNCFKSIDDLKKVKGIGEKIIEKNRDSIKVGECKANRKSKGKNKKE